MLSESLLFSTATAEIVNATAIIPTEVKETNNWLVLMVIVLLLVQSLLIIGLQRSRVSHKRAKLALSEAHSELERRVADRTVQLENLNRELYQEIASHEKTEALLMETQDYLHSILNSMPSTLLGVTADGTITHWNAAAEASTGIGAEQAMGHPLESVYNNVKIDLSDVKNATLNRIPVVSQNVQQGRGSDARYFDITIYPLVHDESEANAVIRIDDVTPRIQMESMLIQNEKMLSLGELAAGLAHEINNPLAVILNGLQNIERRTSHKLSKNHEVADTLGFNIDQLQEYLKQRELTTFIQSMRIAGEQAARIVTNMLEFSRGNTRQLKYENINTVLQHALEMAKNSLVLRNKNKANPVNIMAEFGEHLPDIPCSATEIQQVVINLLRNAAQAFYLFGVDTPRTENTIWLRTLIKDRYLCIEVADNGPGMSDDVLKHVFEPFYTTKDVGQGTGLGLSVSYFIITEHQQKNAY